MKSLTVLFNLDGMMKCVKLEAPHIILKVVAPPTSLCLRRCKGTLKEEGMTLTLQWLSVTNGHFFISELICSFIQKVDTATDQINRVRGGRREAKRRSLKV